MIRSGQTRVKAPRKERAVFKEIKKREDLQNLLSFCSINWYGFGRLIRSRFLSAYIFCRCICFQKRCMLQRPKVISRNAFSTILSPAFEIGSSTEILPSALIFVCMNKFTGGNDRTFFTQSGIYIIKAVRVIFAVTVKEIIHFGTAAGVEQIVLSDIVGKDFQQRIIKIRV